MWASAKYRKEGDERIAESANISMPKTMAKKGTPSEKAKETQGNFFLRHKKSTK
jgi:hypothetical protein